jgi:hypothetical protein
MNPSVRWNDVMDTVRSAHPTTHTYARRHQPSSVANIPGFGASSTVYAAAFNLPGGGGDWRHCAVKVSSGSTDLAQLFREAHILALCRHPNVLR